MSSETDELVEHYLSWTNESVTRLLGLVDAYDIDDPAPQKWRDDVFAIAHDIKGMGASFGFPLMTEIGTTLCHYLKTYPKDIPASKPVVEAHTKAMKVVLDNSITGNGGEKGAALTARLAEITKTALEADK